MGGLVKPANTPNIRPDIPVAPQVKIWKLTTRPLITLGTIVCIKECSTTSYVATAKNTKQYKIIDNNKIFDQTKPISNKPNKIYVKYNIRVRFFLIR